MSDILVVKTNIMLKPDKMESLRQRFLEQKGTGVVVLPPYCTALVVPEDIEIRMEDA